MTRYVISYDLDQPSRDYEALTEKIKSVDPKAIRPLESVWLVKSHLTSSEIVNRLSGGLDKGDKLLVVKAHGQVPRWSTWGSFGGGFKDWWKG